MSVNKILGNFPLTVSGLEADCFTETLVQENKLEYTLLPEGLQFKSHGGGRFVAPFRVEKSSFWSTVEAFAVPFRLLNEKYMTGHNANCLKKFKLRMLTKGDLGSS